MTILNIPYSKPQQILLAEYQISSLILFCTLRRQNDTNWILVGKMRVGKKTPLTHQSDEITLEFC